MAEELHNTENKDYDNEAIPPIYGNAIAPMQDNQLGGLLSADANDE